VHETADHVFRAVVEDWESTAGYSAKAVDVNQPLSGGGKTVEDLPPWTGIYAGVERVTGMLELLAEYFRNETPTPVAVPLGSIVDMATRMLSIALPRSSVESSNGHGAARLHPAIDRDERDGLWTGMPQVYVAAIQLIKIIAERMEEAFLSLSQSTLDQLAWVFPFGRHYPEFRLAAYNLTAKTLFYSGQSFDRAQVGRLSGIIRSCCRDLHSVEPEFNNVGTVEDSAKKPKTQREGSNHNADNFLRTAPPDPMGDKLENTDLVTTAGELLPLLLSHIPQQCLDISLRALVERTAILTHNKSAMLASILNPFVGKNGKAMASILPHLTREFGHDDVVEILLRPRMPLLPSTGAQAFAEEGFKEGTEDEDMDISAESRSTGEEIPLPSTPLRHHASTVAATGYPGLGSSTTDTGSPPPASKVFGTHYSSFSISELMPTSVPMPATTSAKDSLAPKDSLDVEMDQDDESSGNESVHLTMQLDTDSDSDD
jgi:pre-rRNA-processing protein RIX1